MKKTGLLIAFLVVCSTAAYGEKGPDSKGPRLFSADEIRDLEMSELTDGKSDVFFECKVAYNDGSGSIFFSTKYPKDAQRGIEAAAGYQATWVRNLRTCRAVVN